MVRVTPAHFRTLAPLHPRHPSTLSTLALWHPGTFSTLAPWHAGTLFLILDPCDFFLDQPLRGIEDGGAHGVVAEAGDDAAGNFVDQRG